MKKKLLTLVAVFGLAMSSLAMTPEQQNAAVEPQAQGGYALVRWGWERMGWRRSGFLYGAAQAFGQAAGAGAGGLIGSTFGPVGTVIGGGLGAA